MVISRGMKGEGGKTKEPRKEGELKIRQVAGEQIGHTLLVYDAKRQQRGPTCRKNSEQDTTSRREEPDEKTEKENGEGPSPP